MILMCVCVCVCLCARLHECGLERENDCMRKYVKDRNSDADV